MVFHDENGATKTGVVATGIINRMHNMAWLKHQKTDANQNVTEEGEMSGNPPGKKHTKKRRSKHQNPKPQKGTVDNNQKIVNSFEMGGRSSAQPANVWNSGKNVAEELFPPARVVANNGFVDYDEAMEKAMEESLKIHMMEKMEKCMTKCTINEIQEGIQEEVSEMAQKEEEVEEAAEISDEDSIWNKVNRNLPSPDSKEICKNFDTNNNSGLDKVTNSANEPKNIERKGRTIVKTNIDEVPKPGNSLDTSLTPAIIPTYIDKFGRVDGRSEAHIFMGKGARMKEQKYLEQLLHENSSITSTKQQEDETKIDPSHSKNKSLMHEQTGNNNPQDRQFVNHQRNRQSINHQQERPLTNFPPQRKWTNFPLGQQSLDFPPKRRTTNNPPDKQSPDFPPERRSLNYPPEKQPSNYSPEIQSMNHKQERQFTNNSHNRRSVNFPHEKQSLNYQDDGASVIHPRPSAHSFVVDKYHYDRRVQKKVQEPRDYHDNKRESHNKQPPREEKYQKPKEPEQIIRPAKSSTGSSDLVVESAMNEKIEPLQKPPKNPSESDKNSSEIAVSTLPRLADFKSRINTTVVDENLKISMYSSDVGSNSPNSNQSSQASNYSDASANFPQNDENSQYATFYSALPEFPFIAQSSQSCTAENYTQNQESIYANLQLTDPGLYKIFIEKRNRDCCAHRENCSNYENCLVPVDPIEMTKCYGHNFPTPEQQVRNYQQGQSGTFSGNVCSHVTNYPAHLAHPEILHMMRINNSPYSCDQYLAEVGHENSQHLVQNVYLVPNPDSSGNFVPYANNNQDFQIPYQNVQRSLNLQPLTRGSKPFPPGFENFNPNNSTIQTQAFPHSYYPQSFCSSTSDIHGNRLHPQIAQNGHFSQSMSLPKQFNENHANVPSQENFSISEQQSQRNYENYGTNTAQTSSNYPRHRNFDQNLVRNEIPSMMLRNSCENYGNSGGKIAQHLPNQTNFDSPPQRIVSSSIPQKSSNVDVLQPPGKSSYRNVQNQPPPILGFGRGRLSRN